MHAARTMNPTRLLPILCVLGCVARPNVDERFTIEVRALTANQEQVADVRLWADGRELGATDVHGLLRASLTGREGQVLGLSAACPPAYRTLTQNRRIVLRRIEGKARSHETDFELSVACEPLEKHAAIVVRALGPDVAGLPIRVDGETVGQTELDGTAHLLLGVRPYSSLRVQIDTAAYPNLLPKDPVQTFQLDGDDRIVLMEQAFALPRPKPSHSKPHAPAPAPPPTPQLPYRIGSR